MVVVVVVVAVFVVVVAYCCCCWCCCCGWWARSCVPPVNCGTFSIAGFWAFYPAISQQTAFHISLSFLAIPFLFCFFVFFCFFFFWCVSVIWVCGFVPLLFHFVGENVRYLAFAVVVSFLFLVFGLFSISFSFVLFIATSHLVTSRLFIRTALKTSRKTRANKTSETTARWRRDDNNLPMSSTFDFSARRFSVHR